MRNGIIQDLLLLRPFCRRCAESHLLSSRRAGYVSFAGRQPEAASVAEGLEDGSSDRPATCVLDSEKEVIMWIASSFRSRLSLSTYIIRHGD
jgi:hypothetical protein